MISKYSLTSLNEPTDEDLHIIMADALTEVKLQNKKAALRSKELFAKEASRIEILKQKSIFHKNGNF